MDCLRDRYEHGQPAEAAFESYRSGADSKLDWWRVDADGRVDYWSRVVDLGFYSRGEVEPGGSWIHAECDGLSFDEHGQPVVWLPDEVGATAESEDGQACKLLERIPVELEIPADVLGAVEDAYWCQVDNTRPQDCVIER